MALSHINKKGFSLLEIILAITIFSLLSVGIFGLSMDTLQRNVRIENSNEALNYAQEGIEALINMRDRNFLLLTNGDHGLTLANDTWSFIPAPELIDSFFERTVTIEDVQRDAGGAIAAGGTFDPNTKKVISEVAWLEKGIFPRSVTITAYLSDWRSNEVQHTTCTEFETGTFTDTAAVATNGPPNNNCAIELTIIENQSEFFASSDIGDHGNDVEKSGNYAYVASAKTQQGLAIVNVSNPQSPVVTTTLDIGEKGRKISEDNGTLYIGKEKSSGGLVIVNATNPASPTILSQSNLAGKGNTTQKNGTYLYVAVEDDKESLTVFNIANPSNPIKLTTIKLDATVYEVKQNGSYLYLGIDDDWQGLRVMSLANPANPVQVAALSVGEEVNTIAIAGTYAFLGIEDSENSLKVVNISNPMNPVLVASLDVGGEIQDLVIDGTYLYAALDEQNSGLAAVNISTPSAPVLLYNQDVMGKGTGIDTDGNYLYITTNTSNKGLVIVGTTEIAVVATGEYISSAIDTGSSTTRYNFIEWSHTEVPGATIEFQIRTANTAANLENALWVGSDGTINTTYASSRTPIVTHPQTSGTRYIQYKAIINSGGTSAPVIESVTINYTP